VAAVLGIEADRLLVKQHRNAVDDWEPMSGGADRVSVEGELRGAVRATQEACQHGLV
jgi:hypothetical protein